MIIIAHRGNLHGPSERENEPAYIDEAIDAGFPVEIDLHVIDGQFWLYHDDTAPKYQVSLEWLYERKYSVYIHCKNHEALAAMWASGLNWLNYFWHETDAYTHTSHGQAWAYPGSKIVSPEMILVDLGLPTGGRRECGICTDYPVAWRSVDQ